MWLVFKEDGRELWAALAPGVNPDVEAARIVPPGVSWEVRDVRPAASAQEAPPASLTAPQWSFLRRRKGGQLGAVIDAAKAAMPPGDPADMFAAIVDDSPTVALATVLAVTARVRAMGVVPNVPTDDDIRAAWPIALAATPEALLAALGG